VAMTRIYGIHPLIPFIGSLAFLCAHAPAGAQQATPKSADADDRRRIEAQIQDCVRKRIGTPEMCRMIAYSAALATGLSPSEAERLTGYRPKR